MILRKKGDLVDTLECFLNNNQSQKKTSKEMFVHYRTIMYRLRKIVEITGDRLLAIRQKC